MRERHGRRRRRRWREKKDVKERKHVAETQNPIPAFCLPLSSARPEIPVKSTGPAKVRNASVIHYVILYSTKSSWRLIAAEKCMSTQ